MREVRRFLPEAPIVLGGLKLDLRDDMETIDQLQKTGHRPITYDEGFKLAEQVGAVTYLECSAKADIGCQQIFEAVAIACMP